MIMRVLTQPQQRLRNNTYHHRCVRSQLAGSKSYVVKVRFAQLVLVSLATHCNACFLAPAAGTALQRRKIRATIPLVTSLIAVSSPSSSSSSEPPAADTTSMYELYKKVALQDPEWFEEFVVSLLLIDGDSGGNDEILDEELLALVNRQAKEERRRMNNDENSAEVSANDEEIRSIHVPVPDEPLTSVISSNESALVTLETNETRNRMRDLLPSKAAASAADIPPNAGASPLIGKSGTEADEVTSDDDADRVTSLLQHGDDDEGGVSNSTRKQVDRMAVMLQLGYSENEIASLQPAALDFIAADKITRPRTGVPARWMIQQQQQRGDNSITMQQQALKTVSATSAATTTVVLKQQEQNDVKGATSVATPASTAIPPRSEDDDSHRKVVVTGTSRQSLPRPPPRKEDRSSPTRTSANSTTATDPAVPRPRRQEQIAPNNTVAAATATDQGATASQSSTSAKVRSPTIISAVPTQPRSDAEDDLPRRRRTVEPLSSSSSSRAARREDNESPSDRRRQRQGTEERKEPSRPQKVYSGRPAGFAKRRSISRVGAIDDDDDEPPPPKSGVWPDIDTFRNLLRDEAGMRLRILGNDWSDKVKEEAEWRLDLYKNWLWTLHRGVGEPFVRSRSDRVRRQRRTRPDEPLPPPSKRKTRER